MKRRYLVSSLGAIALIVGSVCGDVYAAEITPEFASSGVKQVAKTTSRSIFFTPKGSPRRATGGASRGIIFTPKGAPIRATGGGSRGTTFTPKGAPIRATGGGSRGNIFTPKGAPKTTIGGGSRLGSYELHPSTVAASGSNALIAVIPQSFYGTTVLERPTIMVHLPASPAQTAIFSIKDEQGNTHHRMSIPVAGKSGVMALQLPENAPALEIGKDYQWFLALKVDGELSPSTPYVDGWIQRIQPNNKLLQAMQQQDIYQQAVAFGKEGVWYDCLAKLASLHAAQPNNPKITQEWKELLAGVDLQDITQAPLVISAK